MLIPDPYHPAGAGGAFQKISRPDPKLKISPGFFLNVFDLHLIAKSLPQALREGAGTPYHRHVPRAGGSFRFCHRTPDPVCDKYDLQDCTRNKNRDTIREDLLTRDQKIREYTMGHS